MRIGNVPTSPIDDADNILFAEGEAPRKVKYSDLKTDMLGIAVLNTAAPKAKEAINELNQGLLDIGGFGVISGGLVTAQSTPNMTVQVSACTLKIATGARQVATANTSLAIATANATNPRIDIIYVNSSGVTSYLQGTAASSPTAPSTPTGGILLAQINVAANQTMVTNSNIADERKMLVSTDWLNAQLSDVVHQPALNTTNTNIANHLADLITDTDGAHGLKIETGTWTPQLYDTLNHPLSQSSQTGKYEKINKKITVSFHLTENGLNSASGRIVLKGFPFVADVQFVYGCTINHFNSDTNLEFINGVFGNGELTLNIKKEGIASTNLFTTNIPSGLDIIGTLIYYTI